MLCFRTLLGQYVVQREHRRIGEECSGFDDLCSFVQNAYDVVDLLYLEIDSRITRGPKTRDTKVLSEA